ncbi:MAG: EscU/YscU/HrcU family type III secretion system export apparatus switch protein [Deltaproteobacteria bacterium]|nr:EscU/YscU/HrcU family type III secretion system export apparatus switch protein [Deltaproteobacteria bacterium]
MLEKTEWPNEAKLKRLREEGVVAISPFSCRCVFTLTFLCTLWLVRSSLSSIAADLQTAYTAGAFPLSVGSAVASHLTRAVLIPLLAAFSVSVLWGLFQTRFLFRFGLVALSFERLHKIRFPSPLGLFGRMWVTAVLVLLMLAGGLLSARLCWTGMLYLLNNDRLYLSSWVQGFAQALLIPVSILLVVLALLSWFVSKFLFLTRHRMTRQELEGEAVQSDVTL